MTNFAEMNAHEQKMLNIWLEYWVECYDGNFAEWLAEEIEWYAEECGEEYAEPYRQALAEWQA